MKNIFFDRVAILGVGLLGASFALALKKKNLCNHIIGCGRRESNLKKAKEVKIIDSYELDAAKACMDSDLILFSMPVGSFTETAKKIRGSLKREAIITDVGSVKGKLVREMEELMPDDVGFVGGHPIAGSNRSGIDTAIPDLFLGAKCILTPTEKTDKTSLKKVTELWEELGAIITILSPEEHDMIYAAVSHFPHVVAYILINTVAGIDSSYLKFAGQGFKDTTRIASSSPELWRDICEMNRENIFKLIERFKSELEGFENYLKEQDMNAIEREFKKAKLLREDVR